MPLRKIALLPVLAALPLLAGPARAQVVTPLSWPVGDAQLQLAGAVSGAAFAPRQPDWSGIHVSGMLQAMPELRRDYDSGLSLGLGGTVTLADPLSRGRYDGDAIERLAHSRSVSSTAPATPWP